MSQWREVIGYEGLYLVSDDGRIYSLPRVVNNGRGEYLREGRILKQGIRSKNNLEYAFVALSNGCGETEYKSVHRIVGEAFLTKADGQDVINHKDHNTLNNHADNLEWCTQQYNAEYSKNKAVLQYLVTGELVAEYKSTTYASKITGISRQSITNALIGLSKTAGGYVWEYKEEE